MSFSDVFYLRCAFMRSLNAPWELSPLWNWEFQSERELCPIKKVCFFWGGQKVWFYYPTTSLHSLLAGVAKIMRWSNPICHTDEKEDDESHVTHKLGGVWAFEAGLKVKAGKTETRGPSLSFFLVSFYVTAWIDNINNMKGVRLHSNIYFLKLIYHFSSRAWRVSHSEQWSSRFTSPRYRLCHVELVTLHSLWKQMMSCL